VWSAPPPPLLLKLQLLKRDGLYLIHGFPRNPGCQIGRYDANWATFKAAAAKNVLWQPCRRLTDSAWWLFLKLYKVAQKLAHFCATSNIDQFSNFFLLSESGETF